MSKHTVEPWKLSGTGHIVACVNTCKGIETETMERYWPNGGLLPCVIIHEKAEQHDELLAALKGVVRVADRATVEFDAARAAIAKAEGEQP